MDHESGASGAPGQHSPDARRVVFDMRVLVHGCANIPYHSNARVHCKWKLPGTATASRSGFLPSVDTTSTHLAAWDTTIELPGCVFRVDSPSMQLKPSILRLSVRQENRFVLQGFTRLGIVQIDLADFAGQAATDRTYLLENARLNSTLSVTVFGEQVSGDVMFRRRGSGGVGGVPVEDSRLLHGRSKLDTRATNHNTVSSAHSPQRAAHDHSIYQVVGDILRISEENRLSRNPSQVDTFEK